MKQNNQNESSEDEIVDEKNVDGSSSDFISCYFNDDKPYCGLLEDDQEVLIGDDDKRNSLES